MVLLANALGTEPSDVRPRMRLLDSDGSAITSEGERIQSSVGLGPLEERPFQLMIEVDANIPDGRSAALEVGLFDRGQKRGLVGSLGVALLTAGG